MFALSRSLSVSKQGTLFNSFWFARMEAKMEATFAENLNTCVSRRCRIMEAIQRSCALVDSDRILKMLETFDTYDKPLEVYAARMVMDIIFEIKPTIDLDFKSWQKVVDIVCEEAVNPALYSFFKNVCGPAPMTRT